MRLWLNWLLERTAGGALDVVRRTADFRSSTYASPVAGALARLYRAPEPSELKPYREVIAGVAGRYLEHRFDLLGSGWKRVVAIVDDTDAGSDWPAGGVTDANLSRALALWRMVEQPHAPIDWQHDFKSGFRWCATDWSRDIRIGVQRGVDVKMPWELARMQHLSQLAYAYRLARSGAPGLEAAERYLREVRNQILDFMSANPPRFGVNWCCAMDVAIRVVNWLVAIDLLRAAGAQFDAGFEAALSGGVIDHGRHLYRALEWHPVYRGNHYLAGLAGLLYAAAYLPASAETRRWLSFSASALLDEAARQFLPDGASFEASTGYHRLSGEIVVHSTALMMATARLRPELAGCVPAITAGHLERIERIAAFTVALTRPDGAITQIGDHDSGRFLKLTPVYRRRTAGEVRSLYANLAHYDELPAGAEYWDEDLLDHRHLVAAANGLSGRADFAQYAQGADLESGIIAELAGRRRARLRTAPVRAALSIGTTDGLARLLERLRALPTERRARYEVALGAAGPVQVQGFGDFGAFIYRGAGWYGVIRCGPIGLRGLGAHAHNDSLALEIVAAGRDLARDPGSFLYTPAPEERDRYRSVRAHFAPRAGEGEPGNLALGVFRLGNEAQASCLYFGVDAFLGRHLGYGYPLYRHVAIADTMLVVEDFSEGAPLVPLALGAGTVPFSPKYGCVLR